MFRDYDEQAIVAHGNGSLGQRILASLFLNSHDDEMWMIIVRKRFFFSFLIGEIYLGFGMTNRVDGLWASPTDNLVFKTPVYSAITSNIHYVGSGFGL